MSKKDKSKKRGVSLDEMPIVKVKPGVKTKRFDPARKLRDPNFVAQAFFEALVDNDVDAALEILDGYLMATGKTELAKRGRIAPSTVYHALAHGSNPTLKTVARILHATTA